MVPWEDQFVIVNKLVWVRCRDLPLKLWNADCFGKIAALLGNLVEVDKATLELEELEYARFRIRVPVGCEAKMSSYFKINGILYQVSLVEECTIPEHHLCQGHWMGTMLNTSPILNPKRLSSLGIVGLWMLKI